MAAGCCGTFAFRPTHGELPEKDVKLVCPSLETVAFTADSMARLQQVASAVGLPGEALCAPPTSHTRRACCRRTCPAVQAQGGRQHALCATAAPVRTLACCNILVGTCLQVTRNEWEPRHLLSCLLSLQIANLHSQHCRASFRDGRAVAITKTVPPQLPHHHNYINSFTLHRIRGHVLAVCLFRSHSIFRRRSWVALQFTCRPAQLD